jgi:hypothetical protein
VLCVVVKAQRRRVSDGVVRPRALSVRVVAQVGRAFRVQGAVTEEGHGPLVALLLQALRAHRTEETMGCERDVGSACSSRRPALGAHAAGDAGGPEDAVHAPAVCLRPSLLISLARLCSCDG